MITTCIYQRIYITLHSNSIEKRLSGMNFSNLNVNFIFILFSETEISTSAVLFILLFPGVYSSPGGRLLGQPSCTRGDGQVCSGHPADGQAGRPCSNSGISFDCCYSENVFFPSVVKIHAFDPGI